jgi:hypothetical protein
MVRKDFFYKDSVLVLYTFIVSSIIACLHIVFNDGINIEGQTESIYYLIVPFIIGLNILMSWSSIKAELRINESDVKSYNKNIFAMFFITVLLLIYGINEIIDAIFIVTISLYTIIKVMIIQTKINPLLKIEEKTGLGIENSKHFFWNVHKDGLYTFVFSPEKCEDLQIYSTSINTGLVLKGKLINKTDIEIYEKQFNKKMFDFNKNDMVVIDMIEI